MCDNNKNIIKKDKMDEKEIIKEIENYKEIIENCEKDIEK